MRELSEGRCARNQLHLAVLAAVAALAGEMPRMELVVVPAQMERTDVQRPAEPVARARDALTRAPVVVVAVEGRATDEGEDAAHRLLDDLAVDDLLRGELLRLLDGREVGLVEPDTEDAEIGMAVEDAEHFGQPAGAQLGDDEVGVRHDDGVARGRVDADLERGPAAPRIQVLLEQDQLVEARAVGFEPIAQLRTRGVVDDGDAERSSRPRLERVDHRDQVVKAVMCEDHDVGGLAHGCAVNRRLKHPVRHSPKG